MTADPTPPSPTQHPGQAVDEDIRDFGEAFAMRQPDGTRVALVRSSVARALLADLDAAREALRRVEQERDELRQHILDIDAHATPYGDIPDDRGWIGMYLLTAGALHRALGKIGHTSPKCQAEAERDRMRPVVEKAQAFRHANWQTAQEVANELDAAVDTYETQTGGTDGES